MFGRDVSTGKVELSNSEGYSTKGPTTVHDVLNDVPDPTENICFLPLAFTTCTKEQQLALANGTAVLEDWIVVEPRGAKPAHLDSNSPKEGRSDINGNPQAGGSPGSTVGLTSKLFLAAALMVALA